MPYKIIYDQSMSYIEKTTDSVNNYDTYGSISNAKKELRAYLKRQMNSYKEALSSLNKMSVKGA